ERDRPEDASGRNPNPAHCIDGGCLRMTPFPRKLTRQFTEADDDNHADDNKDGKYDEREDVENPDGRFHFSPLQRAGFPTVFVNLTLLNWRSMQKADTLEASAIDLAGFRIHPVPGLRAACRLWPAARYEST